MGGFLVINYITAYSYAITRNEPTRQCLSTTSSQIGLFWGSGPRRPTESAALRKDTVIDADLTEVLPREKYLRFPSEGENSELASER